MRKMMVPLIAVVALAGVGAALLAQTPLGTGFTFQGRVKQAGQLVDDSCDFEFTLWDAATDGGQVGPTLTFDAGSALPVNQGLFSATLDFGAAALNGDERWLEVAVGCPSGQPLVPVSPRQELTAAPYASYSLDGKPPSSLDAPDGDPTDAVVVDADGNVGIGTLTPSTRLDVDGAISGFGVVPIGSIIAWHKTFTNTPGLPSGWLECDGQTVNDADSAYDGQALPNLNSASGYFGGRFLRGGNVSGTLQHSTTLPHQNARSQTGALYIIGSDGTGPSISYLRQFNSFIDNQPGITDRIRTVNMSVVWIMRVK